jgi:hypothetical protein
MVTRWAFLLTFFLVLQGVWAADEVPAPIMQPGTQPQEISNLESPGKCDNCHGGYNTAVEPAFNWRGSMMAHAGRDPIFWATLAIAEQDFDGAGDLCIRCHSTAGWLAGRSTPTDGSGLAAGDSDGVECDFCHKLTNPDDSEHLGVMSPGFVANDGVEGFYGSGMASMWGGSDKLGPYEYQAGDTEPKHQFMHSQFHRDRDFCGTCHDVSNPAVGHLSPNHGVQETADPVRLCDPQDPSDPDCNPNNPGEDRVAFTNPPYAYGIVERTFSEYKAGQISETLVSDYPRLPEYLQGGALEAVYNAATQGGTVEGNYENPSMPRYFSCQSCHMRPVTGKAANKSGVAMRNDLPLHDMTGGNYWMADAIRYLDGSGKLRLGGGLTSDQISAMEAGAQRAREQLELAATLSVSGDTVKIVNHTGHKLISGYPEGRRMWLHVKWYDTAAPDEYTVPLREDGKYGPLVDEQGNPVEITNPATGSPVQVESILDLNDPNTKIYEAHMGMTKEWALELDPNCTSSLPLSYNRKTGQPDYALGELACSQPGTKHETFHFVLNNTVVKDNRIPPYGMRYDIARVRNALPVPADQYGAGGPGSTYNNWAAFVVSPPVGAIYATIELLYQPTSWEYIQFLHLANKGADPAAGGNAFLAEEGVNMLEAWLNTGMASPYVMASATWGTASEGCTATTPILLSVTAGDNAEILTSWQDDTPDNPDIQGYRLYYDQAGKAQLIVDKTCSTGSCTTYTDTGLTNGQEYCYKVTSYTAGCESDFSNILCATATQPGQTAIVPNVVGLSQAEAETAITDANLFVADPVGTANSDTTPAGDVISQQPAGGTEVQQGSQVSIVVSLGAATVETCADYTDKKSCDAQPTCMWDNKNKECTPK